MTKATGFDVTPHSGGSAILEKDSSRCGRGAEKCFLGYNIHSISRVLLRLTSVVTTDVWFALDNLTRSSKKITASSAAKKDACKNSKPELLFVSFCKNPFYKLSQQVLYSIKALQWPIQSQPRSCLKSFLISFYQ